MFKNEWDWVWPKQKRGEKPDSQTSYEVMPKVRFMNKNVPPPPPPLHAFANSKKNKDKGQLDRAAMLPNLKDEAQIEEIMSMVGNHATDGWLERDGQLPYRSSVQSPYFQGWHSLVPNRYTEQHLEPNDNMLRNMHGNDLSKMTSFIHNGEMQELLYNGSSQKVSPNKNGMFVGPDGSSDRPGTNIRPNSPEEKTCVPSFHLSTWHDEFDSFRSEEGPGIENFEIIGEAKPGSRLLACGFPVHGTSLCMFQWVRHLQDGTRQYIEGATNPEYLVTADDVDKHIAVECIPKDNQGRQGELVRLFANGQNKITCGRER